MYVTQYRARISAVFAKPARHCSRPRMRWASRRTPGRPAAPMPAAMILSSKASGQKGSRLRDLPRTSHDAAYGCLPAIRHVQELRMSDDPTPFYRERAMSLGECQAALTSAERQLAELNDKYLRALAANENARKQAERDAAQQIQQRMSA